MISKTRLMRASSVGGFARFFRSLLPLPALSGLLLMGNAAEKSSASGLPAGHSSAATSKAAPHPANADPSGVARASRTKSNTPGNLVGENAGERMELHHELLQASLPSTNLVNALSNARPDEQGRVKKFLEELESARRIHREKDYVTAGRVLAGLMESNAPLEIKRNALWELALVAHDANQFTRAQQIYAQYLQLFPEDPTVPEVFLRQGMLYREMGANVLALSKFYSVMNSTLNLNLDNVYYTRLVLQAQTEIADTYYLQGKYTDAVEKFLLLLKQGSSTLNSLVIRFKLVRSLFNLGRHPEVVAQAESFFTSYPGVPEEAEVRFLMASSLKQMGQNREAMKQVLQLLASQEKVANQNPEDWVYWQQRAGNDIANQLYKQGDYVNALEIYSSLAEMNQSVEWQLPVWYQIGLIYERMSQASRANDIYDRIIGREKDLTGDNARPVLKAVLDMAKWRKNYLGWQSKADLATLAVRPHLSTNTANGASPQ
jgi:tetratricopeptide (TPR) repeat protein